MKDKLNYRIDSMHMTSSNLPLTSWKNQLINAQDKMKDKLNYRIDSMHMTSSNLRLSGWNDQLINAQDKWIINKSNYQAGPMHIW